MAGGSQQQPCGTASALDTLSDDMLRPTHPVPGAMGVI